MSQLSKQDEIAEYFSSSQSEAHDLLSRIFLAKVEHPIQHGEMHPKPSTLKITYGVFEKSQKMIGKKQNQAVFTSFERLLVKMVHDLFWRRYRSFWQDRNITEWLRLLPKAVCAKWLEFRVKFAADNFSEAPFGRVGILEMKTGARRGNYENIEWLLLIKNLLEW